MGGVVYAKPDLRGSTAVSFQGCTIMGNHAVSMRELIMRRCCMQGSGSVQVNAMAPAGVRRECYASVSEERWLDALCEWVRWDGGAHHSARQ